MKSLRCSRGHEWPADEKDTAALCPLCGAPATEADERTIGVEADLDDATVDLDGKESAPRVQEPETTWGEVSAVDDESDETMPLDDEAADRAGPTVHHRHADDREQTIGHAADDDVDSTIGHTQESVSGEGTMDLGPPGEEPTRQAIKGGTYYREGEDITQPGDVNKTRGDAPDHTVGRHEASPRLDPPTRRESSSSKRSSSTRSKSHGKDPLAGKKSVAGYEILGELGRGGMGVVYKARQPGANRLVALKMVLAAGHAGKEALARFKIEAEAVAQLQHPNIVQLYAVGEEDGCPFFSLEFVDGQSLSRKIDSTPQPPGEAAALVQKLAEAMHAAHQRGIIHRDLKPANILLTHDGTPKITDFGLAKRFEDKGEGQTRTGAIMGTPSYMAPEQAQGRTRETGPPADIYSLGSILYDMLTGRPPFRGTTLLETLQQVQTLEPVPPMRLRPEMPADLQTICLKALEKDPAKRYATAGELAEDLRRFQAGEPILARPTPWYERGWKWARRRPAVASLIGVSVAGVIGLLTLGALWLDSERRAAEDRETQQAEVARIARENAAREAKLRKVAEANFKRARKAVDEMLSQVGQDKLKYIPQMDKVRRELLRKALAFNQEFRKEQSDDPEVRHETALAQWRVADILEKLGDPVNGGHAYVEALDQFDKLAKAYPGRTEYIKNLASLTSNYGNLLNLTKQHQAAEKMYRYSLESWLALAKDVASGSETTLELAKVHNNLATILSARGKTTEAAQEFEKAKGLLVALRDRHPRSAAIRAELARTLNNLGVVQKTLARTGDAEETFLEANRLLAKLVADHGEEREYRSDLAQNHVHLGDLFRDSRPKEAEGHYQQAIDLRRKLSTDHPDVPAFGQELAHAHAGLAIFLQQDNRPKEADAAFAQALKIQEHIAEKFPHLPNFRAKLGSSYVNRGNYLLGQARLVEAEKAARRGLEIFEDLVREHADVPEYHAELAGAWMATGAISLHRQDFASAVAAFDKAGAEWQKLAEVHKDNPEYRKDLASTLLNTAQLHLMQKKTAAAEKLLQRAISLLAEVASAQPENPDVRRLHAIAHANLGYVHRVAGEHDQADKATLRGLELYSKVVADFPLIEAYLQELADLWFRHGLQLAEAKRLPEAERAWLEALGYRQKLFSKQTSHVSHRLELGKTLGNLGALKGQMNQLDKAAGYYQQAAALLEEIEPKRGPNVAYDQELIAIYRNMAAQLQAQNKPGEAEAKLLRILELREKLARDFPSAPELRVELIVGLHDLAYKLAAKEKFAEAVGYYRKAVDHAGHLVKMQPEFAGEAFKMHMKLADAEVGAREHASAVKTVQAALAGPSFKERPLHLAIGVLARCATLAENDTKLPKDQRSVVALKYADQAMILLAQAIRDGFGDQAWLKKSDELTSLRKRDDFQKLLKELK